MKIIFNKSKMAAAVAPLMCAVSGKSTLTSIEGILIEAKVPDTLVMTTYDLEKGCWTTKNLELPKNAGTYKLAYSNDGGETWTQIGHVLTIEISAT